MPTALFLSPHLDDVAFSCGGTVAKLAAAGWRCVIATAFTRSVPNPTGFALACQLDKGLSPDADYMALRRDEDADAAAALGAEAVWLDFPEAPHRGYSSATDLFTGIAPGDDVRVKLADRLQEESLRLNPDAVFAPQGLGNHVDHLQLIRAVRAAALGPVPCWYRDTPYAIRDPQARPVDPLGAEPPFAVDIGGYLSFKLDACAAYRTQVGFQFGGAAAMRTKLAVFATSEGCGEPAERFRGRVPDRVDAF